LRMKGLSSRLVKSATAQPSPPLLAAIRQAKARRAPYAPRRMLARPADA
jgi:poly-beta-hydroxyalkanoate depolymerase